MHGEGANVRRSVESLKKFREAVLAEGIAAAGGEEWRFRLAGCAPIAKVSVQVADDSGMKKDRAALAELGSFRTNVELAPTELEIADSCLAELIQSKARAETQNADGSRHHPEVRRRIDDRVSFGVA